jgi:NitT/TauT family transport system substrate-binding protein
VYRSAALLVALVAVAGACTGDGEHIDARTDATTEDGTALGPSPAEPEVGNGCGEQAMTDPRDLDAARAVARCGPEAPAPQPLPDAEPIRVAVSVPRNERLAPVLLADEMGEFAVEGLDVELVDLEALAAAEALETRDVDVAVGALDAPLFDAVARGLEAGIVLGGALARAPYDPATPQPGLWVRRDLITGPSWANLERRRIALPGGVDSAATLPTGRALGQNGLVANQVAIVDDEGDRAARRLLDREVAGAWLEGTAWLPVARDDRFELATTLPASESLDATVMAGRLLERDREVGEAYVRAVIRTINTYLSGDYRSDGEVVATLADAIGIEEDELSATPPWLFDWELRSGTTDRVQEALIEVGAVSYSDPLPSGQLIDRSLARDAVTE